MGRSQRGVATGTSVSRDDSLRLAQECALHLLARSIEFGHGQLAVVRLVMAVDAGAAIPDGHWQHCRRVVSNSGDVMLQRLLLRAEALACASTDAADKPRVA